MIPLAGGTSTPACMVKLRVHLSARAFLAAREISHVDLLYRLLALIFRSSLEVPIQTINSSRFVLCVTFELIVVLIALVMIQSGISTTIGCLLTCKHDSFGAETPLHPKLLCLAFDQVNHIMTEKHFSLCITILEELLRRDLGLVPKMVYL